MYHFSSFVHAHCLDLLEMFIQANPFSLLLACTTYAMCHKGYIRKSWNVYWHCFILPALTCAKCREATRETENCWILQFHHLVRFSLSTFFCQCVNRVKHVSWFLPSLFNIFHLFSCFVCTVYVRRQFETFIFTNWL